MTSPEEQYTSLLNRIDTYETRLNHTYTALGHHIYVDHHDDIITAAHLIETIATNLMLSSVLEGNNHTLESIIKRMESIKSNRESVPDVPTGYQ